MKLLFLALLVLLVAGCAKEDRSNLLSPKASTEISKKISRSAKLSSQGECFRALEITEKAITQTNAQILLDPKLRKTLIRGIRKLQTFIQEECEPL